MAHWAEAKRLAPHLRVLDVDLGDALLKLKGDPQRALEYFREGLKNDPENSEVYVGLDEAMSLTGVSAGERAAILSQYPLADDPKSKMPADLVYQLALTRAEAGQYVKALALFKDRFFPSEEGGITSQQVVFEIELMQAETWARENNCTLASGFLADKQQGLGPEVRSAREYVKLAGIARICGRAKESKDLFQKAAASVDSANLSWAIQAEKSLGTYDAGKADQRIAKSLAEAESRLETSSRSGSWLYNIGMLQAALNQKEAAKESLQRALLDPDTLMSHHFAREALAELAGVK
jgi:tetratricopeptide (TPR) repeat protein